MQRAYSAPLLRARRVLRRSQDGSEALEGPDPYPARGFSATLPTMSTIETPPLATTSPLVEQVRAVTELLQSLAADWRLLDQLPADDRRRLHQAIAALSTADPRANRKRRKAAKAERVRQEEALLNETGIRSLRRRPRVTTPNVFPPPAFEPRDVHGETRRTPNAERLPNEERRTVPNDERRTPNDEPLVHRRPRLLHLQGPVLDPPRLLRPALPPCADVNFAARTELADLRGRVALLTGGRVKIGYQAGLKPPQLGRTPHRHDPLSAQCGGALRAGTRLRRLGTPARDLRPRSAPHAERGSVLPRPRRHAASGSTSSSTTPARPSGGRRSSTRT